MRSRRLRRAAALTILCGLLAACGGDGGSGFSPSASAGSGSGTSGTAPSNGGTTDGTPPYLPFTYYPGQTNDTTGLFLVSQNNLNSSTFISNVASNVVGAATQFTLNASNRVVSFQRYSMMYLGTGADGNVNVYGLPLATGSALPVQLSNLSFQSAKLCGSFSAQTNLKDPTTLFVVLDLADACGTNDVYEVVYWTDSPSTAVQTLTIPFLPTTALYQPGGLLGGLLIVDSSGTLDFYSGTSFANATVIATGLTSWTLQYQSTAGVSGNMAQGDAAFLDLTSASGEALWRISYDGTAGVIYTVAGQLGGFIADDTNLYFYDAVASTSQQRVYQQPINSTIPAEVTLYTATPVVADFAAQDILAPLQLLGSNDQQLVMVSTTYDLTNLPPIAVPPTILSSVVQSLNVGAAGPAATIAGPFSNVLVSAFMTAPTVGDYAAQNVYVDILSAPNSAKVLTYTGAVFSPEGAVLSAALANSTYIAVPPFYRPQFSWFEGFFGPVLQFSGITDTTGTLGGSTITPFSTIAAATGTPLLAAAGGIYHVPAGQAPILVAASSTALTGMFTELTGAVPEDGYGAYSTLSVELFGGVIAQPTALAIDLTQGLIAPITQPGATVTGF